MRLARQQLARTTYHRAREFEENLHPNAPVTFQQRDKLSPKQGQNLRRLRGHHPGRPLGFLEHGQLTKEISRATFRRDALQGRMTGHDLHPAAHDDVEPQARIPLIEDHLVLLVRPLVQQLVQLPQLARRQPLEQAQSLEALDPLVVGGHPEKYKGRLYHLKYSAVFSLRPAWHRRGSSANANTAIPNSASPRTRNKSSRTARLGARR